MCDMNARTKRRYIFTSIISDVTTMKAFFMPFYIYILQIVKGTIDGAFRVGCKKRGKWPQAKGMHADITYLKKLSLYWEKNNVVFHI